MAGQFNFFNTPVTTSAAQLNANWTALRSAFIAAGWVQTTDTGQIDLTTNVATPALGASYQMYRADDALQATAPIFCRVSMNGGGHAAFTVQLGTSTNGAGTLTGTVTTIVTNNYNGIAAASSFPHNGFSYGDPGNIWVAMNARIVQTSALGFLQFFAIERSKDLAGVDTGDYVTLLMGGANAAHRYQSIHYTHGLTNAELFWPVPFPYTSLSSAFGGFGGALPVLPMFGKIARPMMNVAVCKINDYQDFSNVPIVTYGATRYYKVFNSDSGSSSNNVSGMCPASSPWINTAKVLARWG
jgi:hypothetical protein